MCGRTTLIHPDPIDLRAVFGLEVDPPDDMPSRFNIAPTQAMPVVTGGHPRQLSLFRWGLIPSWAKDPSIGNKMINARAETIAEKPSFRTALRKRRCLVVADGWYEWQQTPDGKQPWHFRRKDGKPFGLAGLWEVWKSENGEMVHSCTIVTTSPNAIAAPIHDRMPVVLPPKAFDLWLGEVDVELGELLKLLVPSDPEDLIVYPVSKAVNNARRDDSECVRPLDAG